MSGPVEAALADLAAAVGGPKVDQAALDRWHAHRDAALAERICPLDGAALGCCGHVWHGGSAGLMQMLAPERRQVLDV